jgi:hypothetical protein
MVPANDPRIDALVAQLKVVPHEALGDDIKESVERVQVARGQRMSVYMMPDGAVLMVSHSDARPTQGHLRDAVRAYLLNQVPTRGHA